MSLIFTRENIRHIEIVLAKIHPIALLLDELKSEDVLLRLASIHRLSTIALALGAQRTRDELIPFLHESLDDEDEVLLAIADELGAPGEPKEAAFVEYIGGRSHAHVLLSPLENLAAVEETLVREHASVSIQRICFSLSQQQVEENYLPLLRRLSTGDWFTSRMSATSLYRVAYSRVGENIKTEMRRMFSALCGDDTPMVRRAAAKELGAFAKTLSHQLLLSEMIPVLRKLGSDDQDSVRLLTVDALITIAENLNDEECKTHLGGLMKNMVSDKSWRVRFMVADHFVKLALAAGEEIVREELVGAFVNLLKDNEAEVRTAAAGQIPGFAKLLDRDTILNRILPCVRELATDMSQHVRTALANQISGLAPLFGKEATIEHLLPLFLQLLKDEFPDVRLNIISKLEQVNSVIGIDLLSQALLPAIMELAEDKQIHPLLATQLGVQFFDEKLSTLCLSWLGDPVYSIRESATVNLKKLTEVFGVEWAQQHILPKVIELRNEPNYLKRMTAIFAITTMAPALTIESIRGPVLDAVVQLTSDPIPNIRFNVSKALEVISSVVAGQPGGKELAQSIILPSLEKLRQDRDADVRFFADKAAQFAAGVASGEQTGARDAEMST
ncbi:ARM repeat-containing protein [Atractiella rhizophila]|nr:ARM repeat-containing protein [Atractiella rhizophila]